MDSLNELLTSVSALPWMQWLVLLPYVWGGVIFTAVILGVVLVLGQNLFTMPYRPVRIEEYVEAGVTKTRTVPARKWWHFLRELQSPKEIVATEWNGTRRGVAFYDSTGRKTLKAWKENRIPSRNVDADWDIVDCEKRDGKSIIPYPIRSRLFILDPLFVMRVIVFTFTKKHIVHIPFFLSPVLRKFKSYRQQGGVWKVVEDVTDHALTDFTWGYKSENIQTAESYQLHFEIEQVLALTNVWSLVYSFLPDGWSYRLATLIDTGLNKIVSTRSFLKSYGGVMTDAEREAIHDRLVTELTDGDVRPHRDPVTGIVTPYPQGGDLEEMGLRLLEFNVKNPEPADTETQKEMEKIASGPTRGRMAGKGRGKELEKAAPGVQADAAARVAGFDAGSPEARAAAALVQAATGGANVFIGVDPATAGLGRMAVAPTPPPPTGGTTP